MTNQVINGIEYTATNYNGPAMSDMAPMLDTAIESALDEVLADFVDTYELIGDNDKVFDRVEHKAVSGFIPFTDGGFSACLIFQATEDTAHCPRIFQPYIASLIKMAEREFFNDQTGEYPEDDAEQSAYFDKLTDSETGLETDKELWYEYERTWLQDCPPALEVKVLYYGRDNSNHPGDRHPIHGADYDCILICLQSNTDAPYYRDGKGVNAVPPIIVQVPRLDDADAEPLDITLAALLKAELDKI